MSRAAGTPWLAEQLATGAVSRVQPNPARSGDLINQARRYVSSARVLAADDPTLALAACHDAIRKALDAHLGSRGLRVENRPGAHKRALDYATFELGEVVGSVHPGGLPALGEPDDQSVGPV